MVLVNGAEGIGTGWSTNIPCYNPRDIISNLLNRLENNMDFKRMDPYYRNYNGIITFD